MSHFVVLVVGANIAHELAPFHEFECTGTDDEFVENLNITNEVIEGYASANKDDYPTMASYAEAWHGMKIVPFGTEPNLAVSDQHKYGYTLVNEDGAVTNVIKRTNPNAKWDWYVVGGRWGGFLLTKDGEEVDSAPKGDIDFEAMRKIADDAVRDTYVKSGYEPSMTWRPWSDVQKDESLGDPEARRTFYHNQPELVQVKDNLTAAKMDLWFFPFDKLLGRTADEYVDAVSDRGITPYAMVKDRQWAAKGEMGWWGLSNDAHSQADWNQQVWDAIQALPDDTLLTAVDCHI